MRPVPPAAPRPSRGWHVAALGVLALGALVNGWEWLAADRMPAGDFPGYAAQVQTVRDALLERGRVPRWCVECYGGTTRFTGHLKEYLVFPLALAFEPVFATKLAFLILKLVAALGLYALVVRWFAAPGVGLVAGYVFGFGAIANHQVQHLDVVLANALMPPTLLAGVELLRRGGPGPTLALGVLVACQLVNNWVYALPVPVMCLALAAYRPWDARADDPWRDPGLAVRWALRAAAALAVFALFAGSQLAWLAGDARNHRLVPPESTAIQREIYVERSPFLFVNRAGALSPWLESHQPPGFDLPAWDGGRRYLGGVVLVVCALGWAVARREERLRRWGAVAGLLLLFQYWLALGPRTLLWEVGESFGWSTALQASVAAALQGGAVAGLLWAAFRALGERGARGGGAGDWRRPLLVALLLLFPTASLWSAGAAVLPVLEVQRSPGHFTETAPLWLALLFAVGLVALVRRIPHRLAAHALLVAVGLAVAVDFWPSRRTYSAGSPMPPLRRAAEQLASLPGEDGTLRVALPIGYSPLASWLAAQTSAGHAWGWLPWQASEHWAELVASALYSDLGPRPDGRGRFAPEPSWLEAARIRYLLVGPGRTAPPPPWRLHSTTEAYALWEQPAVAPMATVRRAHPLAPGARGAPPPSVGYSRPHPERIELSVEAGAEGAVVLVSQSHHPWWRAMVDGEPAPVWRARLALLAVPVGPGSHRVALELVPPAPVRVADAVGAAAWLSLALGWPWMALRRGRRRAGSDPPRPPPAAGHP